MSLNFEDLPPMEDKCRACESGVISYTYEMFTGKKKKKVVINSSKTCENCQGKGKFLTPFGKALINLVQEWTSFKQELSDLRYDVRNLEER